MKWINMLLQFLMNLFVKKVGAEEIEAPQENAQAKRALLMGPNKQQLEDQIIADKGAAARAISMNVMADVSASVEELKAQAEAARAEAEVAKAEAEIAKAARDRAAKEQEKAEASAAKVRAELEAKLSQLAKDEAQARQAEYDLKIAEADALIGKARAKKDESNKSAETMKKVKEEIAEITDEEVFCDVNFSVGGDAYVWIFKRVGTDVIFVDRKLFNPKDFNKRPGSRQS